jgi:hypothetical protein
MWFSSLIVFALTCVFRRQSVNPILKRSVSVIHLLTIPTAGFAGTMTVVAIAVTTVAATMTQVETVHEVVVVVVVGVLLPGQVEVVGEGDLKVLLLDLPAQRVSIVVNAQFKICSFPS